ncbi:MAG: DUF6894 family protein [Janthinobacterium lividum]
MAKYYLNLRETANYYRDECGVEVADVVLLRARVVHEARGTMSQDILDGELSLGSSIEVTDETGAIVLTVKFGDAVAITAPTTIWTAIGMTPSTVP